MRRPELAPVPLAPPHRSSISASPTRACFSARWPAAPWSEPSLFGSPRCTALGCLHRQLQLLVFLLQQIQEFVEVLDERIQLLDLHLQRFSLDVLADDDMTLRSFMVWYWRAPATAGGLPSVL